MLEHQVGCPLFAQHFPDLGAEGAHAFHPFGVTGIVLPVRQHAPVVEFVAVDAAFGAELHAVVEFVFAGDHGHRGRSSGFDDLNGHGSQATGAAPDQGDISLLDGVGAPAVQHAPGGGRDQGVGCGFFPVHVLGLGHALLGLNLGELGEAAPVGFVTPDAEGRRVHGIAAALDPSTVAAVLAAVHHDFVAHLDVGHVLADFVDDAGGVAAADVEVFGFAGFVAGADDVDWNA